MFAPEVCSCPGPERSRSRSACPSGRRQRLRVDVENDDLHRPGGGPGGTARHDATARRGGLQGRAISSIAACTVVAPSPLSALAYGTSPAAGAAIVPVVPPAVPDITGLVPSQESVYAPTAAAPARTPRRNAPAALPGTARVIEHVRLLLAKKRLGRSRLINSPATGHGPPALPCHRVRSAILTAVPKSFGGETVSTGVCKVQVACRGARGLVKTGKKRKANDNAFALAA